MESLTSNASWQEMAKWKCYLSQVLFSDKGSTEKKNCASLLSKTDFVCTNSVEALQDFTSLCMVFHMNWAFHNSRKFALYDDFLKISGYL